MAKAKTFTRKITRKVIDEVPGYVELNLTPEEAEVLLFILDRIGGAPAGARGRADNIRKALVEARGYGIGAVELDSQEHHTGIYLK